MRIIVWNCNRAFRNKMHRILQLKPDIIVVPECENPDKPGMINWISNFSRWKWFGEDAYQGVGIFAVGDIDITDDSWYDPDIRFIRPFNIRYKDFQFDMIAVWANNRKSPTFRYIGQVWKYLQSFGGHLTDRHVLMLGDFNSNAKWDVSDSWWNHSDVVKILMEKEIRSLYHYSRGLNHGKETEPTFYFRRDKNRPYHTDYIFSSQVFVDSLQSFIIGQYEDWAGESDHMPIMCDFDDKKLQLTISELQDNIDQIFTMM